jgi:hypothetical protein
MSLRGLKPRDVNYAVAYVSQQLDCVKKWNASKVGEEFYKRYRLGLDTFAPLYDKEFYKTLSIHDFPNLFLEDNPKAIDIKKKVKKNTAASSLKKAKALNSSEAMEHLPNLEGLELPPIYILVEDRIPDVRKKIIYLAKRYIAIRELDTWISKNGIALPQIETKLNLKVSNKESADRQEMIAIIDDHFKIFIQEKSISDGEYLRLKKLLTDFFLDRDSPALSKSIIVKHRTTQMLASILGGIYFTIRNCGLSHQYLALLSSNIEQFNKYSFTETNYQRSNLYKYLNIKS